MCGVCCSALDGACAIHKGSAIFIHLTENYRETLGCIALKKNDLLILLKLINKKTKIQIL